MKGLKERPVIRRAEFWLGCLGAILAFALIHGVSEYQIARTARAYRVVYGVKQELTPSELVFEYLIRDTVRAFPIAIVAVVLLCLPLLIATRGLRSLSPVSAFAYSVGTGIAAGAVLSIVTWLVLGAWGPPFLFSAMASGSILAPALVAARRIEAKG